MKANNNEVVREAAGQRILHRDPAHNGNDNKMLGKRDKAENQNNNEE